MTPLHLLTVLQLLIIGNLLAMAMVLAYEKRASSRGPVRLFILSKLLQATGWTLICLRGTIPLVLSAHVGNPLIPREGSARWQRLTLGSEVRLMGAYLVRCTGVDKDEAGNVVTIHAEADLETRNGNPADGRKVRGTIHWVSCEHCVDAEIHLYDKLFTEANMNGIPEGSDYKDYLNPESVVVCKGCKLEESLKDAKPGEKFQFVRTGYFTPDSKNPHVYNRIVTLKDSFKF